MDTVLIPAYEPDKELITLTKRLKEAGFAVVIVDDGSGPAYEEIFDQVKDDAQVLTHKQNRGKGAALKTGMVYIRDHMPQSEHFITCDADGQHQVEDVIRVSEKLQDGHKFVLTMRKRRSDIPWRSKIGNFMSRVVYALLTKRYLSDNQSGLRGFHRSYIDWLVKVENDKYDYEMNMLYYAAKKAIPVTTILIDAIYINNNQASHFHPIKDTVRIYRSLFRLAIGLFIGFGVAEAWIIIASILFGYHHILVTVPGAGILAYGVNMVISNGYVFRNTRCHDWLTLMIHQIIAYTLYLVGCILIYYACPRIPMWLAYNLVFLVCIPLRYWLHKFTVIALRTQE